MERFRSRANAEELRQFERLASAEDAASQVRATKMVLFKLTGEELYAVGVVQTRDGDDFDWLVAESNSSVEVAAAIQGTLMHAGMCAWGSGGHGACAWYVPRERFFEARQVLLASPQVQSLHIDVVTPEFSVR
jgi:hypothetical protein